VTGICHIIMVLNVYNDAVNQRCRI